MDHVAMQDEPYMLFWGCFSMERSIGIEKHAGCKDTNCQWRDGDLLILAHARDSHRCIGTYAP